MYKARGGGCPARRKAGAGAAMSPPRTAGSPLRRHESAALPGEVTAVPASWGALVAVSVRVVQRMRAQECGCAAGVAAPGDAGARERACRGAHESAECGRLACRVAAPGDAGVRERARRAAHESAGVRRCPEGRRCPGESGGAGVRERARCAAH
jgi:hypothetical protein